MLNAVAEEHTKHNNGTKRLERPTILLGRELEKASFRKHSCWVWKVEWKFSREKERKI